MSTPLSSDHDVPEMQQLLDNIVALAHTAGQAIMSVYEREEGFDVDRKSDSSPLTEADLAADRVIKKGLEDIDARIPVLSEEGEPVPFQRRQQWQRYWLVDPLDGTKEFVNRNGEFTVNIALIDSGEPILGVVYVPVLGVTYAGARGFGAYKHTLESGVFKRISARPVAPGGDITVVASRRHGADALDQLLADLEQRFGSVALRSMGSSLKLCLIAEGQADLYPRLALTSEWDTAAAQAIVDAAGGEVWDASSLTTLRYNTKDSVLNPFFHVVGDPNYDWKELLG